METQAISNSNPILHEIQYRIGEFNRRIGIMPTHIIISDNMLKYIEVGIKDDLIIDNHFKWHTSLTLFGLKVLIIEGKDILHICIL